MTDKQPQEELPERRGDACTATSQNSAEAKRLEARRRFLRGGAAALSTLITMSPGRLGAVTVSECAHAFPQFSVFIVNFNRERGRGGSDQALLNCLNLINRAQE
jgi:hypothetical protein